MDFIGQKTAVLGVPGELTVRGLSPTDERAATCFVAQQWRSEARPIKGYGENATIRAEIRFDDGCRNGKNSFAITAEVRTPRRRDMEAGGCLHSEIASVFPELAPLIKWHLCSTDGPMHYIANTAYLAGDRDYNGLRQGETRQIINGRSKLPCWELRRVETGELGELESGERHRDCAAADLPPAPEMQWFPLERVGEGKERELDAARRTAVWPEATDEQLCAERGKLEKVLAERLPGLIADFRADIEAAGLFWAPPQGE